MTEQKEEGLPTTVEKQEVSPSVPEGGALDRVASTARELAQMNRRLNVAVISSANPPGPDLLAARQAVTHSQEISEAFVRAREGKWDNDRLADHVANLLGPYVELDPAQRYEAARYLVDEYTQVGDSMLMVDRVTGRAIAQITDDDLYVPEPVPREDGTLAVPLPRIRPEIEAFLVHRQSEEARDHLLFAKMTVRAEKSGLVTTDATRRALLPVTQQGRRQLVDELRDLLPTLLQDCVTGPVRRFLGAFEVASEPPAEARLKAGPTMDFYAEVRTPIQDPTTFNLRFNRLGMISRSIANQWVYEVARQVLARAAAPQEHQTATQVAEGISAEYVWAAVPEVARVIAHVHPMIVTGLSAPLVGAVFPAGVLVIDPTTYRCEAREVFDRWEVAAVFKGTLWLDEETIRTIAVSDLPVQTVVAEILP